MPLDVLNIFGLLTVDIARDVQVEFVLLDFLDADHSRVFWYLQPLVEYIDDLVNVHVAQAILVAVFEVAAAGGDASAVKQVGRQAYDAFK